MGFIAKVRNFCARVFGGCHGLDALGKATFALVVILVIILNVALATQNTVFIAVIRILYFLEIILFFFRVLSKNNVKRTAENYKFLQISDGVKKWFKLQKDRISDRKTHVYRKCPKCRAVLRLRRIKGSHRAACPRCGNSFDVRV